MAVKRGQALMELIVGILALALVVSVLCAFAIGIAKSLRVQNRQRVSGTDWRVSDRIELPNDFLRLFK